MTSKTMMDVGIYYFYHGFGLKAFEGRHIIINDICIQTGLRILSGRSDKKFYMIFFQVNCSIADKIENVQPILKHYRWDENSS